MPITKDTYGDGKDCFVLPPTPISSTTPIVSKVIDVRDKDAVSLQLIVDFQQDVVAITPGDAVVASTGVWTFAGYTFTGKTGSKLLVIGAANAGNDGTFPITAVGTHTATTATTGLVNESFGPNVQVFVIRSETASVPEGTWTVAGVNDYVPPVPASSSGSYGAPAAAGHFSDISALFSKPAAIAAVTTASSQIVQADPHLDVRGIQITFTPSAGIGPVSVAAYMKNWSR
jgi:hypothetical protein